MRRLSCAAKGPRENFSGRSNFPRQGPEALWINHFPLTVSKIRESLGICGLIATIRFTL